MRVMHIEAGRHLYGGAAQVRYLIEGLEARGVESVLVCPPGSEIAAATRAATVVEAPMAGDLDARLAARLRRVMTAHVPSLVHVHSRRGADTAGGLGARWAGVPAVLTRRVDSREWAPWARLKYRPYRAVVAISSAIRDQLVHRAGLDAGRVFVVPSAVDTERYRPAPARERLARELGVPAGALKIGVVAQLIPRKGHALLLETLPGLLARFPDVYVLCFGRGPLERTLSRRLVALGIDDRVKLAGFRRDLPDLLPGLDLLVHPAEREGLGVAVLEAMSAGLPVVASAAGGLTDLVEHETEGLLFEAGDGAALAEAIVRMLSDPELRTRCGAAGRSRARAQFSVAQMSDRYLRIYNRVLERCP